MLIILIDNNDNYFFRASPILDWTIVVLGLCSSEIPITINCTRGTQGSNKYWLFTSGKWPKLYFTVFATCECTFVPGVVQFLPLTDHLYQGGWLNLDPKRKKATIHLKLAKLIRYKLCVVAHWMRIWKSGSLKKANIL